MSRRWLIWWEPTVTLGLASGKLIRSWPWWALPWLACVLLTGCASWRLAYDVDAQYDFARARSAAIMPMTLGGMQPVWVSELVARRLEQALGMALRNKGLLLQDQAHGDLLVEPGLHAEPEADMTIWGGYSWWSPYGPHGYYTTPGTTQVNARMQVVLFLNVRDRPSKRLVYRAWSTESLGPRAPDEKQLQRIVSNLLRELPVAPDGGVGNPHPQKAGRERGSSEESAP